MTLWTVQNLKFYESLLTNKIIYGRREFIEDEGFLYGYHWLMEKMDDRVGKRPFSGCYPIWAWYQWDNAKKPKPDLRFNGHLHKGEQGVRMEIIKNDEDVLLSDFELWHYPLSLASYIGSSEKDVEDFEDLLVKRNLDNTRLEELPKNIQHDIIKSWDIVLDIEFQNPYITQPRDKKINSSNILVSIN
ncbi:DUF3841 domain-containing protein [Hymenobacter sp. BT18]|uniref:DUF3841 domain-containing protein n=1 Tax=Hymenobacter sp. BT18 TaxID=2835648 RepID=UPI00143E163A|nr:DUF3841 domain-containing protein [Hymenobacter sp. BT18]QIX62080.1 DUF3841 domain-containing protein [Hymenobacter sp. BT18]